MTYNNILLGTSGWSYEEWEGPFYQKGEKRKLRAYCRVFSTVEIDSTWYRVPAKGTVIGWLKYSPSGFVYTAKIPKLITHEKKLGLKGDIDTDLQTFFDVMRPLQLGGKLGCMLIQLPPSYAYNLENLESFFQKLEPQFKFAIEFRNLSWMKEETWQLLTKYKVAYVSVDEPLLPPDVHLTTADFAYFRWHGRGTKPWFDYRYSETRIGPMGSKSGNGVRKGQESFRIFQQPFSWIRSRKLPSPCSETWSSDRTAKEKQGKDQFETSRPR